MSKYEDQRLKSRAHQLESALEYLFAQVRGECPRLLNEDSGGDADLAIWIDELLSSVEPPPTLTPERVDELLWPLYSDGGVSWEKLDVVFKAIKQELEGS